MTRSKPMVLMCDNVFDGVSEGFLVQRDRGPRGPETAGGMTLTDPRPA